MKDSKQTIQNVLFGLVCGIACGLIGILFNVIQKYAALLRGLYPNKIFLLLMPFIGLLVVLVTKLLGQEKSSSGNVIAALTSPAELGFRYWLNGMLTLTLTNIAESSMVREGGALQPTVPAALWLRKKWFGSVDSTVAASCAVAAGLSSIWGIPVFATLFAAEMGYGLINFAALLPSLVSSFTAYILANIIFPNVTEYACAHVDQFAALDLLRALIVGVACGLFAKLMIAALDSFGKLSGLIKNAYVRIFAAGAVMAAVCYFSGSNDFLCGFNSIMTKAFTGSLEGDTRIYYAFAAKLVFFGLLSKSGYKTGWLIQTWSTGALFGALIGFAVGLTPGLGAMLGTVALFAGTYNVPISAVILFCEIFPQGLTSTSIVYVVFAVFAARIVSGSCKLYAAQNLKKDKI